MPAQNTATDALTLLRSQHLEVERLFSELERLQAVAQGGGVSFLHQRREVVKHMVAKLSMHTGIEEELFYPAVRRCVGDGDGDALAEHAVAEHQEAKKVLKLLDGLSPDNIDFDGDVRELMHRVREHVREEETEIFPRVREAMTQVQLLELGAQLEKAMKHAPTRPHPSAPPATTTKGRLMAKGAAVMDRARDLAMGRHVK